MAGARVLIVEDDDLLRRVTAERLERQGHTVATAASLAAAREELERHTPDVALLDVKLPDGLGTDLVPELARTGDTVCVMMSAHGTVQGAVDALRSGAVDYMEKPFSFDRLDATLRGALERTRLRREVRALREQAGPGGRVVGDSPAMREVFELVQRVAPAEHTTVLLEGETGTGKGMIAQAVHRASARADGPFVNVTCSALAETVLESELFGHEKGAFTDARALKRGLVELADGGTLFLDEIGEMPLRLQGKLLRFLEDRTFRRVGGTRDLTVDARLIAATNRDLQEEVEAGRFREDLLYRLRVFPIRLPPLRERPSDIPALAKTFADEFARQLGRRNREIPPETMDLLRRHLWPGNVRELRNLIERSVLLADGPALTPDMLPPELLGRSVPAHAPLELGPEGLDLDDLERSLLDEALRRAEGNRTEAGRLLGMSRHQVRNRLKKYGIDE
ncbi:MAG TPA: sigma-54 dependent transcriptional regulator [Longimicrobiales bacterium]|nr:sigma-54 dependent transcriptional regulator [Longimicrobiales bacterium]